MWCKPRGHDLGNGFGDGVNETNGTEIRYLLCPFFLWEKYDVRRIEPLEVFGMEVGEKIDHLHNLQLDNLPTRFIEDAGEAIGTWRLVTPY